MSKVRLSLSVRDLQGGLIDKVARAAKRAGMKVEHRLDDLGVLTGTIDEGSLGKLRAIEGVSNVEQERQVGIPKPDSPIQ
jgi:hypothetical protein